MAWLDTLRGYLENDTVVLATRVVLTVLIGWLFARGLSRLIAKLVAKHGTAQQVLVARRGVLYLVLSLVLLSVLRQLGLDFGVLLGAAGILTVALGFASQTSASNVISGLFLLGEQTFVVGEVIQVGGTTGEVLSIDLLSVKLRTLDNLYVRVPNETLIKSEIVNLTRFPIRRVELLVPLAYKEDIGVVSELLIKLAERTPEVFVEPKPEVHVQELAQTGVVLRYLVWTRREGWYELRTKMMRRVKDEFDAAGIEVPFPHLSYVSVSDVAAGSAGPKQPH
ncbi:Small-conductance mechanosensitive channel [Enhygromyxa salina]|uniref:Small-conductance mechanosensitive channel n=1 Tax=Enhygromyxa salina TaxID=215803 RepID=A0A2S9YGS0_9BACT|nr:mechanosensitive ion channel family protein [Enhygromyxa salina]PRQ04300.1 Small-conductance mechanosensitive channel [Enhygromyxa salina]